MTRRGLSRLLPAQAESRALVLATLLATTGSGMFVAGGVIFLIKGAGFSSADITLGLTIAGCVALAVILPVGMLADRVGPREVAIAMFATRAAAAGGFLLVHSLPALAVAASVAFSAERAAQTAIAALTAEIGGEDRVRLRAYIRAVNNVGISVGALIAGALLAANSPVAYTSLMLANGVALVCAGAMLLRVPRRSAVRRPRRQGSRLPVLRDRPYVCAAALHAVLSLNYDILGFALPLWVVTSGAAPSWLISVLIVLNTTLVVAFQVRASRGVRTAADGAAAGRRAGLVFLLACGLVALTAGGPVLLRACLLVVAVAVLTVGELWNAAASFALSFELAKEDAQGQYQAVYVMGDALERALAPAILGTLCVAWGAGGWLLLGGILAAGGALLPAVVHASERRHGPSSRLAMNFAHGSAEA